MLHLIPTVVFHPNSYVPIAMKREKKDLSLFKINPHWITYLMKPKQSSHLGIFYIEPNFVCMRYIWCIKKLIQQSRTWIMWQIYVSILYHSFVPFIWSTKSSYLMNWNDRIMTVTNFPSNWFLPCITNQSNSNKFKGYNNVSFMSLQIHHCHDILTIPYITQYGYQNSIEA